MYNASVSRIRALLIAAFLLISAIAAPAQPDRTRRIRFARGRTSTVIKDAVVRGTRDRYLVGARSGQTLIVHITSLEENAVFDIHPRGSEQTLDGAEETTDWSGELPRTGDYVIVVGGTRGNASYTLEVTIR
jgi:hypothetical protein